MFVCFMSAAGQCVRLIAVEWHFESAPTLTAPMILAIAFGAKVLGHVDLAKQMFDLFGKNPVQWWHWGIRPLSMARPLIL